jgi:hypothetical protein
LTFAGRGDLWFAPSRSFNRDESHPESGHGAKGPRRRPCCHKVTERDGIFGGQRNLGKNEAGEAPALAHRQGPPDSTHSIYGMLCRTADGKKPANIIPVLWQPVPWRIPKTLPDIQYKWCEASRRGANRTRIDIDFRRSPNHRVSGDMPARFTPPANPIPPRTAYSAACCTGASSFSSTFGGDIGRL